MWRVRNRFLGCVLKRDSCSFFRLKVFSSMGSFCKNLSRLSRFLSVVCIYSPHICLYCTCQDPLKVWAAQDTLWSLSGAQTLSACWTECCLSQLPAPAEDWNLTWCASTKEQLLQVHISSYSGSYQWIFPNFHCWLCWHQLWRV